MVPKISVLDYHFSIVKTSEVALMGGPIEVPLQIIMCSLLNEATLCFPVFWAKYQLTFVFFYASPADQYDLSEKNDLPLSSFTVVLQRGVKIQSDYTSLI